MENEAAIELYMRGGCGAFAIALQRIYGYKLGSYLDDENIEYWDGDEEPLASVIHVFAHDGDNIIDVKGIRSVEEMKRDFWDIEGRIDWDVSVEEIMNEYSGEDKPLYEISEADVEEAIEYIRSHSELYGTIGLKSLLEYLLESDEEDYRGLHRAPGRDRGAPLWDVTKDVYPDDIYTLPTGIAARYYGSSESGDIPVMSIIQSYRNKPNRKIKIYRAIPDNKTVEEEIYELEGYLKQMLRRGRAPKGVSMSYDEIRNRIEGLKSGEGVGSRAAKIKDINPGDWVTIYRPYAVEHGESSLRGEYKVLSKTVYAKDLYTDGNSIYEWGWDPT